MIGPATNGCPSIKKYFAPAGSVVIMPAGGIPHYGWASEETIVQVHIDGPLQITYVDPEDDPRNKK